MRPTFFFGFLILLTACAPGVQEKEITSPNSIHEEDFEDSSRVEVSSSFQAGGLEQLPSELSIEHFSRMRLVGSGLTLTRLTANDAYTHYAADYYSNGLLISGIMNIPNGDGPFPLVVLNHGHISPSVYTRGRGLKREQDFLAREGFAVFHTDYRGHGDSDPSPDTRQVYDAGLEYAMDSINAINAVRAAGLPQVDAEHVGMVGHSLGGGVTLNVATAHPDMVDAIMLYAPVHSDAWENFMRWRSERDEGDRTREAMGTREENPQAWDALSSMTHLSDIAAPVLLFHGTNDSDVPKEWSDFLDARLTDLDKDITYVEYEGEKHEFVPQWNNFMERTAAFFNEHLRPQPDTALLDETRVTKKPFGIRITPADSPISPEKFTGYHTGMDFEVFPGEDESTIAVPAICDGSIVYNNWVNGYGGVAVQRCTFNDEPVTVLYGHLNADSISFSVGDEVEEGQTIGYLGRGYSDETDGERPHLHLSVHRGTSVELKGYVQSQEGLSDWINPLEILG